MKIVFMGTPSFAARSLKALYEAGHEIVGVYTQADKEAGRGKKLKASEVKELALEYNLPVFQPLNFKNPVDIQNLANLNADLFVVAAYGLILPQAVLDLAPAYNIHASLLPKLRGASPIQNALINGDSFTGVTIMQMELGLDSGAMLLQKVMLISQDDTFVTLQDALAELGAELIVLALHDIAKKDFALIPQNNDLVTYAKKITKQDGLIQWSESVESIRNKVRAYFAWPNSYSNLVLVDKTLKVSFAVPSIEPVDHHYECGVIVGLRSNYLVVACAGGLLHFSSLKPEGKKFMPADAFWNGYLAKSNIENKFVSY